MSARDIIEALEAVQSIRLRGTRPVAVGELTSAVTTQEEASLYHKNLHAVTYVTGDLAGKNGSPVYAILQMNKPIGRLSLPEGYNPGHVEPPRRRCLVGAFRRPRRVRASSRRARPGP